MNPNQKILFVGGPKDGCREAIPGATTCLRSVQCDYTHTFADPSACVGFQTFTYTIHRLHGANNEVHQVAADSSVPDVMAALVKGYRYHRPKRTRYSGRSKKAWPSFRNPVF